MIELVEHKSPPVAFGDSNSVYVYLYGKIIGSIQPSADGKCASVFAGAGIDSSGLGVAYSRDMYGRPACIFRRAVEMILSDREYEGKGNGERLI